MFKLIIKIIGWFKIKLLERRDRKFFKQNLVYKQGIETVIRLNHHKSIMTYLRSTNRFIQDTYTIDAIMPHIKQLDEEQQHEFRNRFKATLYETTQSLSTSIKKVNKFLINLDGDTQVHYAVEANVYTVKISSPSISAWLYLLVELDLYLTKVETLFLAGIVSEEARKNQIIEAINKVKACYAETRDVSNNVRKARNIAAAEA